MTGQNGLVCLSEQCDGAESELEEPNRHSRVQLIVFPKFAQLVPKMSKGDRGLGPWRYALESTLFEGTCSRLPRLTTAVVEKVHLGHQISCKT